MLPRGACRTTRASARRIVSCSGVCASSLCSQIPHVPAPTFGVFPIRVRFGSVSGPLGGVGGVGERGLAAWAGAANMFSRNRTHAWVTWQSNPNHSQHVASM